MPSALFLWKAWGWVSPKKYGALKFGRHLSHTLLGLTDSLALVANHFQVRHPNVTGFGGFLLLVLLSLTLFTLFLFG